MISCLLRVITSGNRLFNVNTVEDWPQWPPLLVWQMTKRRIRIFVSFCGIPIRPVGKMKKPPLTWTFWGLSCLHFSASISDGDGHSKSSAEAECSGGIRMMQLVVGVPVHRYRWSSINISTQDIYWTHISKFLDKLPIRWLSAWLLGLEQVLLTTRGCFGESKDQSLAGVKLSSPCFRW